MHNGAVPDTSEACAERHNGPGTNQSLGHILKS